MKPTKIDAKKELLVITCQCHKVCGGGLIKFDLVKLGLQVIEMGLKREIVLLSCEKRLDDLYHKTNVDMVSKGSVSA